jgi:hypothetical protein
VFDTRVRSPPQSAAGLAEGGAQQEGEDWVPRIIEAFSALDALTQVITAVAWQFARRRLGRPMSPV